MEIQKNFPVQMRCKLTKKRIWDFISEDCIDIVCRRCPMKCHIQINFKKLVIKGQTESGFKWVSQ